MIANDAAAGMIGRTISHYRILKKIGSGGMGVVYEAEDINLHRHVATKFLPENLYRDEVALERFEREARMASLLNHPNICAVYEIEEDEGKPFLVMELLEGEDLRQRMNGSPIEFDQVLEIGIQVADALEAAHAEGVVHRDIKPANIFLNKRGQVRLMDFGLAKLGTREASGENGDAPTKEALTKTDVIPGTAPYMSPEQVRGDPLDGRSDIFSLGVVLYELATGHKPFAERSSYLTVDSILHDKPISPLKWNPKLPPDVEPVLGRALEKKRDKRYPSATDLRDDLQQLKRVSGPDATASKMRNVFAGSRTFRWWSPKHIYLQLALAGLITMVFLSVTMWWARHGRLGTAQAQNSIAVLPLENVSVGGQGPDALGVEMADQISTVLMGAPSVEVHPVGKKALNPDPQRAGEDLRVATVVTGHYARQDGQIKVTLQAVEVRSGRMLWQSTVTAPTSEAAQQKIGSEIRDGLMPLLTKPAR